MLWPADLSVPWAASPFSVCSMICLMAFFRLLALSISCSRGLKMADAAVEEEEEEELVVRGEQGAELGGAWGASGSGRRTPSPSSCSSAMVGGGAGGSTVVAWASSFRVFSRESSFSFRTPHWQRETLNTLDTKSSAEFQILRVWDLIISNH